MDKITRVCPACAVGAGQLLDPDCLACFGTGIIVLGWAALSIYDEKVVSCAVQIAFDDAEPGELEPVFDQLHEAGIIYRKRPKGVISSDALLVEAPSTPDDEVEPAPPNYVDVVLPLFEAKPVQPFRARRPPLRKRR